MADQSPKQEVFARWQISAYPQYQRGALWYVITGLVGGGLLVAAFMTYNLLLAALIVMVGVVLVIQGGAHPPIIDVEIGSLGIRRGARFFPYKAIDHFWIVYDPPIKGLHFTVPRSIAPGVHVPIDGENPTELRDILRRFIREDMSKDSEPILDSLSRILKI